MSRAREFLEVEDHDCWTEFNSDVRVSYIREAAASGLRIERMIEPRTTNVGGKQPILGACLVQATIRGIAISFLAYVVATVGHDEDDSVIDLLIGRLTMREWGLSINDESPQLDLTHFAQPLEEFAEV